MTGKIIDSSANRILILILPIALVSILLSKTWPYLLALLSAIIVFKVWQQYQWQQWSKQVNPFFNQLIKENQGCLTPLDLSMKANLSGSAAQRYLDRKAEEFGAKRLVYADKGSVYYFLTAGALGSIFESSEPPQEPEYESLTSQAPRLIQLLSEEKPDFSVAFADVEDEMYEEDEIDEIDDDFPLQLLSKRDKSRDRENKLSKHTPKKEQNAVQALIQAELAKRLDVHSSTVGKRKSDSDFAEWSQSKDPEGIAWAYSPETKEFVPLKKKP
ncbi:MAG TPA: hypothetical protein DDZ80_28130 [Cyanobacteria bacterium UBA8803]|nr:hypothetical protein [Cyanobacteria bacterium UBA9273]HBL62131.1 hypothetical protein [Cyanobacteria bacterium UBA8803]